MAEKLHTIKKRFTAFWHKESSRKPLVTLLEITLIGIWTLWVAREYLNFDPRQVPAGREFGSAVQTHHLWTWVRKCGWCGLWNGSLDGGYPAFADIYGSMLHPLVMLSTLLFGVINGAKVGLVIALFIAGIAQWWLARKLDLGKVARMWSAFLVVVAGHLTGRMELGVFGVMFSTALSSLVIVGIIDVAQTGRKRSAVLLGLFLASALLAGQGYVQIGIIGLTPALLVLVLDKDLKFQPVWKMYVLALTLALMLAAVFLVPFLHFSPRFIKDTDSAFQSVQPLKYIPLNLVVDKRTFYQQDTLDKLPYPYLYTLFIGWIPVMLAVFGLTKVEKKHKKLVWFFLTGILMELLIGSALILKPLSSLFPKVAGIRFPSLVLGVAMPFVIALAAYGLDQLLKADWPQTIFRYPGTKSELKLSLKWLMVLPLVMSLYNGYQFSTFWVYTTEWGPNIDQLLRGLVTDSSQWVAPPFGEHYYMEKALSMGLKVCPGIKPWKWDMHPLPEPRLIAMRGDQPPDTQQIDVIDQIPIYINTEVEYAEVVHPPTRERCDARSTAGLIRVRCKNSQPGTLVVKENYFPGWKAWRDGSPIYLTGEDWLEVDAPPGEHNYTFRYRPWDVPLGMGISAAGIILSAAIWHLSPPRQPELKDKRESP